MKEALRNTSDVSVNAECVKSKEEVGKKKEEECMSHMTDEVMHAACDFKGSRASKAAKSPFQESPDLIPHVLGRDHNCRKQEVPSLYKMIFP